MFSDPTGDKIRTEGFEEPTKSGRKCSVWKCLDGRQHIATHQDGNENISIQENIDVV